MQSPTEIIEAYLQALLNREQTYYAQTRTQEYRNDINDAAEKYTIIASQTLETIAKTYLTNTAFESHGKTALAGLVVSKPPQYKQKVMSTELKAKTATVICAPANDGLHANYLRYTLVNQADEWRINLIHYSFDAIKWQKKAGL